MDVLCSMTHLCARLLQHSSGRSWERAPRSRQSSGECLVALFCIVLAGWLPAACAGTGDRAAHAETAAPSVKQQPGGKSGACQDNIQFEQLKHDQLVSGFRTEALYLAEGRHAIGARFKHLASGMLLDLIQIQTAPQAFIWVNTPVRSDSGAAHTQEHLLLGKGSKGRSMRTAEQMCLVEASAMTKQWRTCYHFSTTAGAAAFYAHAERLLDALLNPDYDEDEIKREVCHYTVEKNEETGELSLKEKGTVYNEMSSSVHDPAYVLWRAESRALYGTDHPLYFSSGGTPEGLRKIVPAEIYQFHKRHYALDQMGMIAALPKSMPLARVLSRLDAILVKLQKQPVSKEQLEQAELPSFPPPRPMAPGTVQIVSCPDKLVDLPEPLEFTWPARLELDSKQELLLELFLSSIAGDASTPFYKKFVDSRSRVVDLGCSGVYGSISEDEGFPISIMFTQVNPRCLNRRDIESLRSRIRDGLAGIANLKDGSPELLSFNRRVRDHIAEMRRGMRLFVNSPPGFGRRHENSYWMDTFIRLGRSGQFERSLAFEPELAYVEEALSRKDNIWRRRLKEWHLIDTVPYATAVRSSPELLAAETRDEAARCQKETERLCSLYKTEDRQAALLRYSKDYDATTARLEEIARGDVQCALIDSLPLTQDDELDYKTTVLGDKIPYTVSTFDNMTGGTAGVALRLDGIDESDLLYVTLLPELLTRVGVIENGHALPYDMMLTRLRREIHSLSFSFSTNFSTGRCELVLRSTGTDPVETARAVQWMRVALEHPYWKVGNLSRLRDLLDQKLSAILSLRQAGYEEMWDRDLARCYGRQENPLLLTSSCFLSRYCNVQRLRWQLVQGVSAAERRVFTGFMKQLGDAAGGADRGQLQVALKALKDKKLRSIAPATLDKLKPARLKSAVRASSHLPSHVRALVNLAAVDLGEDLLDVPDSTLTRDWHQVCFLIAADVQIQPAETLTRLERVRKKILRRGGARFFMTGSKAAQNAARPGLAAIAAELSGEPFVPASYSRLAYGPPSDKGAKLIEERLRQRDKQALKPVYIGLVHPNLHQGVVINSIPAITYDKIDDESLLRYLSTLLYSGGGAKSMYMKTWAAGLAYGNGLNQTPGAIFQYYADKCPSLPDTLRFVNGQLRHAGRDAELADYAVAQAFFSWSDAAYESRGEGMADALADGVTPQLVRRFRSAVLALRKRDDLADQLYRRMLPECARVLPGLVKNSPVPEPHVYMIIGDDKQCASYDGYLKSSVGSDAHLFKIYGRDFWLVPRSE